MLVTEAYGNRSSRAAQRTVVYSPRGARAAAADHQPAVEAGAPGARWSARGAARRTPGVRMPCRPPRPSSGESRAARREDCGPRGALAMAARIDRHWTGCGSRGTMRGTTARQTFCVDPEAPKPEVINLARQRGRRARGGFGLPTRRSTAGRRGRTLFTLIGFFNQGS